MIRDKEITQNYTYLAATNYWAPLNDKKEEPEEEEEQINTAQPTALKTDKKSGNKWTRRLEKRQQKQKEHQIIIDSVATSHFLSNKINLPNMGQLKEEVFLPDGSILQTSNKTLIPFEQLTMVAHKAAVLPGLKKSLASVSKWADEGYTTIYLLP